MSTYRSFDKNCTYFTIKEENVFDRYSEIGKKLATL